MMPEKKPYASKDLALILAQVCDLGSDLKSVLQAAIRAAEEGDQKKADACMEKASVLMSRIGNFSTRKDIRTGRPQAEIRRDGDCTLGRIRNALRLGVTAGTFAGQLGISESTFRRRMRKTKYLPDELLFSQIP